MDDTDNTYFISAFQWLGIDQALLHYEVVLEHELYLWSVTPEQELQNLDLLTRRHQRANKSLILMLESNPFTFDVYEYILNLAATREIPVKIFSSNVLDYFGDNDQLVYYPTWYYQQHQERNYQTRKNKKFRFSFLSNQARFHRLYLYHCCMNAITQQDCVAVRDSSYKSNCVIINKEMATYLEIPVDLLANVPYASAPAMDDYYNNARGNVNEVDYTNRHNAYASMINITGESDTNSEQVFLSEKTWKPLRSGCLTMTLGNDQTVTTLKRLGFAVPELVDPELPLIEKIHYIADKMSLWTYDDCCTIYNDNRREIDHNQSWFYSSDLKQQFVNQIKHKLEIA
jgi:hypothetical protein